MTARALCIALTLPLGLTLAANSAGAASDTPDARTLYEQNCVRCHQSEVFTRPDHQITSLKALGERVRWCETNLELRWFDEEVAAVTTYLNDTFYHFKP